MHTFFGVDVHMLEFTFRPQKHSSKHSRCPSQCVVATALCAVAAVPYAVATAPCVVATASGDIGTLSSGFWCQITSTGPGLSHGRLKNARKCVCNVLAYVFCVHKLVHSLTNDWPDFNVFWAISGKRAMKKCIFSRSRHNL